MAYHNVEMSPKNAPSLRSLMNSVCSHAGPNYGRRINSSSLFSVIGWKPCFCFQRQRQDPPSVIVRAKNRLNKNAFQSKADHLRMCI